MFVYVVFFVDFVDLVLLFFVYFDFYEVLVLEEQVCVFFVECLCQGDLILFLVRDVEVWVLGFV